MFKLMMRKKKRPLEDTDDTLEAARKKREGAAIAARASLVAEKQQHEAETASTARQEAALAVAARAADDSDVFRALTAARDPRAASAWYYEAKGRQGPFSPSQMRAWFEQGQLPSDLRIAPSFADGSNDDLRPMTSYFEHDPFNEPMALPPRKRPKQKKLKVTGDWLKDSISRQKAGIHHTRQNDGPGMIFEDF